MEAIRDSLAEELVKMTEQVRVYLFPALSSSSFLLLPTSPPCNELESCVQHIAVRKVTGRGCHVTWYTGRARITEEETLCCAWANGWTWWGGMYSDIGSLGFGVWNSNGLYHDFVSRNSNYLLLWLDCFLNVHAHEYSTLMLLWIRDFLLTLKFGTSK